VTQALREGLPAHGRFHVCLRDKQLAQVEVSALPLVSAEGFRGAVVAFWRTDADANNADAK
jgi:hypothetical protein